MSDSTDAGPGEAQNDTVDALDQRYGADWVGIDRRAMATRRAIQAARIEALRQEELERRKQELEQIQDDITQMSENPPAQPASKVSKDNSSKSNTSQSAPTALVSKVRIQNLRSFSGEHEVHLAPLTLVYGPNAAGKSTVLLALKLLMEVVNAGRFDAIHAWQEALEKSSAANLTTYSEPDPEDPSGYSWRTPLAVGVDFNTRSGPAKVDLHYEINPVGPIDVHSSSISFANDQSPAHKQFVPKDFDGPDAPFHPGDFGSNALPQFRVTETQSGNEPTTELRSFDAELFAHPDRKLQADLFELAFLMRYHGPHRGTPGEEYEPTSGVFNSSWYDLYRKPRIGNYDQYELLNQMLAQLEIPYEFEKEYQPEGHVKVTQDWIMRDTRSGARVRLDQVGYGVSQLLPVVDDCIHAKKQIICIEEPELHLHPRLQARLGNLFATSVKKNGNQVIVETHSENVLLRVRRLIRGGKLRAEDVAVLYVDNVDKGGATVSRLRLGHQGELLDPWPTGFFDDSLADILGTTE